MILAAFTLFHVLLSLAGIGSGLVVLWGLLHSQRLDRWTSWFLATTVATNVTGFLFPYHGFKPSYVVGALSLAILAFAIAARYKFQLQGGWRKSYVISAISALYFNVFVLVVQLFAKIPLLKELAPTQSEPPFAIVQLIVFCVFVSSGVLGVRRFNPLGAVAGARK